MKQGLSPEALEAVLAAAQRPAGNEDSLIGRGMLLGGVRRSFVTCLAVVVLAGTVADGQQGDRSRAEALARRATERQQALQREADQLASEERTLLNDLRRLEVERQIKAEDVKRASAAAEGVAAELAATAGRIDELERRIRRAARCARAPGGISSSAAPDICGCCSPLPTCANSDAPRAWSRPGRRSIASGVTHQRTLESLKSARSELEERSRRGQTLRAEAERTERAAMAATRARRDRIRDIDQRRDLNAQLIGELQNAQQKLQLTLRDLSTGSSAVEPATLPLRPFRGALEWPVPGAVRRRFGQAAGTASESKGIEIAAPEGTPVQALHDGVVVFADPFTGFGNLVILDHGGQTFSLYGICSRSGSSAAPGSNAASRSGRPAQRPPAHPGCISRFASTARQ